jgi:hypothetical protein
MVLHGVAGGRAMGNVRTPSASGVELELSRARAASYPRRAVKRMNAPAMKSTSAETSSVKAASVKSTGVETASTVEAAAVEAAAVETAVTAATVTTAAAVTSAARRISQIGDRCCHNRCGKEREQRQHLASFGHTTLHPIHDSPASRRRRYLMATLQVVDGFR